MKKLALALTTLLTLSACGKNNNANTAPQTSDTATQTTQATAPAPAKERKAEHYAVGTTPDSPPFIFKDENGLIIGFDVDVLQAIADDQNFSLDLLPSSFESLFDDMENGKYQILAANLSITTERQAKYKMSKPYVFTPNVIMGKEGATVKTLADIGENKVAVLANSVSHEALTKAGVKNIFAKNKLYEAYGAFVRGEVDYVIGDAGVLNYHHLGSGLTDQIKVYTSIYDNDESAYVGYLLPKDKADLVAKINTGLANIHANGKYDEIYKKWFGNDLSLKVPTDKL